MQIINRIIVSTDSPEIKEIALKTGVEVIDRPDCLSTDSSSSVSALKHVLENIGENFENVILLQPTNPLRPENLLKDAFDKFEAEGFESLMTVSRNRQKFGKIINDSFVAFNYKMGQRSQDLEPLYFENGLLYITKTVLIQKGILLGINNCPFIVDHPFVGVDIDTEEDFEYAEFILKKYL
jgi:N-acylneuraminate cytidylyltransferase